MKAEGIYEIFNALDDDSLSFVYNGTFSPGMTEKIIDLNDSSIETNPLKNNINRRISFIIAECFQNLIIHGNAFAGRPKQGVRNAVFSLRRVGEVYVISSINLVAKSAIEKLKSKLDYVNNLSHDELKKIQLEVLSDGILTDKGGASLGLIEMALKSGNKLEYHFEPFNTRYHHFYLQVLVHAPVVDADFVLTEEFNIINKVSYHLLKSNILLLLKSDFATHSIVPVISMVEENISHIFERGKRKKVFHILVELLQNIAKYSLQRKEHKEGILAITRKGKQLGVLTGNYVSPNAAEKLRLHIEKINSLSKPELNEWCKVILQHGPINPGGGAGIGLIDIARENNRKLDFELLQIEKDVYFFLLSIDV